jgi:hypothetical protein
MRKLSQRVASIKEAEVLNDTDAEPENLPALAKSGGRIFQRPLAGYFLNTPTTNIVTHF